MKVINFNKENLKESDIDEAVVRIKVFLVNEDNQIIIASSNGGYQLPGGHLEEG